MKNLISTFIVSLLLLGCDVSSDMRDFFGKQEKAAKYTKDKYGLTSQLGFNLSNGQLTQATLVLNTSDVANKSVLELEKIAADVVGHTFETKPLAVYIQLYSEPK